jgi:phosphate starvation-inducible PhoH-like protein
MKEANRERKNEIKYKVTLNDEQKETKRLIRENQIVVITGRAGCGKSLVSAVTALDFLNKKECDKVFVTRATVEVGHSLGFLPGALNDKFNPYIEALIDNLNKCQDPVKTTELVNNGRIIGSTIQFIRGKTIDDVLLVEEAQNMSKHEMLAILTRLGKTGKIIINGDNEQKDIKDPYNGLSYAIDLAKKFPEEIKWVKLKHNHRSDLVGKILDYEYSGK